jgi:hypothetical protein
MNVHVSLTAAAPEAAPAAQNVRKGEVIGGGFFVFRRGNKGRYEHGSFASAIAEAKRLQGITGGKYEVFTSLLPNEPLVLADDADWDFDPRVAANQNTAIAKATQP